MSVYPYKCKGHIIEVACLWKDYQPIVYCSEHDYEAPRTYAGFPPLFSVDRISEMDFTVTQGRNFHNRKEYKDYLRAKGEFVVGEEDPVWKKMKQDREDRIELMKEVTSRGRSWEEYLTQEAAEKAQKDAELIKEVMPFEGGTAPKMEEANPELFQHEDFGDATDWMERIKQGEHPPEPDFEKMREEIVAA